MQDIITQDTIEKPNFFKRMFSRKSRDTGPLGGTERIDYVEDGDTYTRARRKVESFSEDYLPRADKAMLAMVRAVGYALPFVAVVAVGTDVGQFYSRAWGAFSSYLLGYAIEAAIAALTVMIGHQAQKSGAGIGHWVKFGLSVLVWLIAVAGSGFTLYLMALASIELADRAATFVLIRTVAVCLLDVMSICILFWRTMTLKRHTTNQKEIAHGVLVVTEAEIAIEEALHDAAMRREQAAMEMEGKRQRELAMQEFEAMGRQVTLDAAKRGLLTSGENGDSRRINAFDRGR